MTKLKSSLKNGILSLVLICLASGAILAAVNKFTSDRIATSRRMELENTLRAVLPPFSNSPLADAYMAAVSEGDSLRIFPAKRFGQVVGVAVESNTMRGYLGEIRLLVGFDSGGNLIDYRVLEHSETPGLGDKMEEWFRSGQGDRSVLGRNLSSGLLRLRRDGGEIDAITSATLSSRAFLDAINRAYVAFRGYGDVDALSGATQAVDAASGATGVIDATSGATPAVDAASGATQASDAASGATQSSDAVSGATPAVDTASGATTPAVDGQSQATKAAVADTTTLQEGGAK